MKKIKYFVFVLFVFLVSGCAEVELPPEGSECSWYINDTYDNANWLYSSMANMLELDENPSVNFWYNGTSDYGVNFTGLKDDVEVTIYDNIKSDGVYEVTVCGDNATCTRLSFKFNSDNIKQSSGGGNCPYPTLYYRPSDATEAIPTYYFSTGYSSNDQGFINIYNSKDNSGSDNPSKPVGEEENWCSTFYRIEDQTFSNDTNLILYFWENEDGLVYAIDKIDSDIELTDDNVADYSEFNTNYNWQSVKDKLTYYDEINSTTFTLTEFSNMDTMITEDYDGKLICPKGYIQQSTSGATTGEYDGEEIVIINGEEFRKRVQALEPYMRELAEYKNISIIGKLPIKINGTNTNFAWFGVSSSLSGIEDIQLEYLTEQKISDVISYCNAFYDDADKNQNKQNFDLRMEECISFNEMLNEAAGLGLIRNLSSDCDILTNDLIDKLIWFLDIIKVAGPILAIGLGTLDFIKTVASGDADKEMKTTFKRFGIRLIAAALLFLVPFMLAFLMDLFLGNQSAYNSDNPFCGVVEWSDYNEN